MIDTTGKLKIPSSREARYNNKFACYIVEIMTSCLHRQGISSCTILTYLNCTPMMKGQAVPLSHCPTVPLQLSAGPIFSLRVRSSIIWEASSQGFRKQFCKKRKQFFLVLVRFFSDSFGCSRELWSFKLFDLISHDRKQGKTMIFDDIPSQHRKGFSDVRTCNNTRKQLKNYALAQTGGKHGKNVFCPSQIMQPRFCSNNPHQCFGNL